ncbi:hypothetical protein FDI21_gp032 [Pseudomonas phage Noxifer]|uniref:Uncharacterized protein n=1 Tax=Pseudomonas phage Noxifer TaxID=2006684 RepID=A0A1Y0SZJ7_9CAUD|nr:hypothetical protein FDI21_gp032 [Pseudomonas phage Noxifer]ARV77203.1 hypothetical protein NOXIFER_32 [Pseudomonas phage Noxifer]
MGKSSANQIDEVIASHLELNLFQFQITIKHTLTLNRILRGLLFAYSKDGVTYYDTVPLITECNGLRIRLPKFAMHPSIRKRIAAHQYQRWYVYDSDTLYPLQMAKPSVLEATYPFKVNDDVLYRTQIAYLEETMFLRKKSLLALRPIKHGWGVTLRVPLLDTA